MTTFNYTATEELIRNTFIGDWGDWLNSIAGFLTDLLSRIFGTQLPPGTGYLVFILVVAILVYNLVSRAQDVIKTIVLALVVIVSIVLSLMIFTSVFS